MQARAIWLEKRLKAAAGPWELRGRANLFWSWRDAGPPSLEFCSVWPGRRASGDCMLARSCRHQSVRRDTYSRVRRRRGECVTWGVRYDSG
jgi:hypothetical protein